MNTYIGCSGFYYNHWKTLFYPEGLPKKQWLTYYAEHFNTVEINNTFYRMPLESSVRNWHAITPEGFMFSIKGYRYLTHLRKLIIDNDSRDYLKNFEKLASLLREKTGPLLWQLPGSFNVNIPRLDKFCSTLSKNFRHVFEFRNASWFVQDVYAVLEKYGHSICIVSSPRNTSEVISTDSGFSYLRFHGEGSWYNDDYSDESLKLWKEKLVNSGPDTLFAYFNNDINAFAVKNGLYFSELFRSDSVNKNIPLKAEK